jgi:hypothetical protein
LTRSLSSTGQQREKRLGYNEIGWFPETTTLSTDRDETWTSRSDKFLVLTHGTADEVAKVKDILQITRPADVALHASVSTR